MCHAEHDLRSAILGLALSLEVARDTRLARFDLTGSAFKDTKLLRHLTTRLEKIHPVSANAEIDLANEWPDIRRLYTARGHVAHGKTAMAEFHAGTRRVTEDDLKSMIKSVFDTLTWIERISK